MAGSRGKAVECGVRGGLGRDVFCDCDEGRLLRRVPVFGNDAAEWASKLGSPGGDTRNVDASVEKPMEGWVVMTRALISMGVIPLIGV